MVLDGKGLSIMKKHNQDVRLRGDDSWRDMKSGSIVRSAAEYLRRGGGISCIFQLLGRTSWILSLEPFRMANGDVFVQLHTN